MPEFFSITASEARDIIDKKNALQELGVVFREIETQAKAGKRSLLIGKLGSHKLEILREKGFAVETQYNDSYEMRVEGYKLKW